MNSLTNEGGSRMSEGAAKEGRPDLPGLLRIAWMGRFSVMESGLIFVSKRRDEVECSAPHRNNARQKARPHT